MEVHFDKYSWRLWQVLGMVVIVGRAELCELKSWSIY